MYQKLTFLEIPHVWFAHEYATSNYDIRFTAAPKQLEFTFYEKGDVIRAMEDGSEELIAQGTYQLALFDKPFRMYSCAPACSHITVGFRAAYRLSRVSREDLLAVNRGSNEEELSVYFPTEGLQLDEHNPMKGLLQRLSILSSLPENAQKLRCTALLLELMALLTEETIRTAVLEEGALSPSGLLYARRAVRYIAAHLSEKITLDCLSETMGICPSYLSALFKAYTGRSIVDYTNAMRVEKVKELLLTRDFRLREAGVSVGVLDENYMSRLFKKYTGQSVQAFQRMNYRREKSGEK